MAVIYIVILIGVLVFVHEFGHYVHAKANFIKFEVENNNLRLVSCDDLSAAIRVGMFVYYRLADTYRCMVRNSKK